MLEVVSTQRQFVLLISEEVSVSVIAVRLSNVVKD